MCKAIVFAGTTEGRKIAEFLAKQEVSAHICVATEYGEQLLPKGEFLEISHERLDMEQMAALIEEKGCPLVIDATHPYAVEVTENIQKVCGKTGAPYVRVLRKSTESRNAQKEFENDTVVYADSVEDAVSYLEQTEGNILATTGSKEAVKYTALTNYQDRVYLRVLPLETVVGQCRGLGFSGGKLICMQGPFSTELNAEMLRQWNCKYLVTKLSGAVGGFPEKAEAAKRCGCTLVVIGRPVQETGISVNECKRLLCEKFQLQSKAEISLVGIGMGSAENRTEEASKVIREADLLIGADRMLRACAHPGQETYCEYNSEKIAGYIKEHPEYEKIAVVLSGDVGFYSGAKKLLDRLQGQVRIVCGISSVAYFMSRIQKSWEDVYLTSTHGRAANLIALLGQHKKVFSILGERDAVSKLAEKLLAYGMEQVQMYVGERLSYAGEKIQNGKPADFLNYQTDALSVVYLEDEQQEVPNVTHGISDREFIRDKVPMTKEEVRAVSLSKLQLKADSVCYDIGAGTGSVAIEMALRAVCGKVYAIEKKPEAVSLIEKNRQKFAADNLQIIEGYAPEAMEGLEAPTHAFIGGSSGNMREIINVLLEKNPNVRIVINCIALESVSEALACMKTLPVTDVEMLQLSVSKAKILGNYHMMMGENPIYIISCAGKNDD